MRYRKVSLMFGQYRISTSSSNPTPPPTTKPQNDQNVTVMQQASVCQVHILYRQKQILKCTTELPLEQHSVHACIRSQLRLLQVSAIWFYYILYISPNFKTCSNLEQATHNKPLQCHQFVLHGLAYLLSTSTT